MSEPIVVRIGPQCGCGCGKPPTGICGCTFPGSTRFCLELTAVASSQDGCLPQNLVLMSQPGRFEWDVLVDGASLFPNWKAIAGGGGEAFSFLRLAGNNAGACRLYGVTGSGNATQIATPTDINCSTGVLRLAGSAVCTLDDSTTSFGAEVRAGNACTVTCPSGTCNAQAIRGVLNLTIGGCPAINGTYEVNASKDSFGNQTWGVLQRLGAGTTAVKVSLNCDGTVNVTTYNTLGGGCVTASGTATITSCSPFLATASVTIPSTLDNLCPCFGGATLTLTWTE